MPSETWVALGVIGRPRGLAGEVWFRAYSDRAESVVAGTRVRLVRADETRDFTVSSRHDGGNGVVLRLKGLESREAVEPWVRATLELRRRDFAPLPDGEWYQIDLLGLPVRDANDVVLGTVARVETYPSVDAVVVKTAEGEREFPLASPVLLELDVPAGRIVVDPAALDDGA